MMYICKLYQVSYGEGKNLNLFDLHCDTLYECANTGKELYENDLSVNYAAAQQYNHYAQFFALFCGTEQETDTAYRLLRLPMENRLDVLLETAQKEFQKNASWITLCRTGEDLTQAVKVGKAAAFLSVEGAELLASESHIIRAYQAGVRMVTLSWNHWNTYACGAMTNNQEGLSLQGKDLLKKLCMMGVIIDVSHLSEQGFWDVCDTIDCPFIASHSDSCTLRQHPRNLTDQQFIEIARRGGLVGINLYTPFLVEGTEATLDNAIDHIEYFIGLAGEKNIALGCDLDGCTSLPIGIHGLCDIGQLAERMRARGFSEKAINNIFYDNAFAFVQKMLL